MPDLVIAEKPSVAQAIAKVLGCTERKDGYLSGGGYLVSWCVGHLVELAEPEDYDSKYEKWNKENLPIIPTVWRYQVTLGTKKQFLVIKDLMKRDDVECVINACDAGREGELIFRLVYNEIACKKKMKRLWISSLEDEAILKGFEELEDSSVYEKLYESALCRERADWIVGINATRFFSVAYGQTLNVGRVMTPTLALVVEREAEIRAFNVENTFSVRIETEAGILFGTKLKDETNAKEILEECLAEEKLLLTKAEKKEKQEKAPALFDLTALQREANHKLGYSAQQTLDYTQALYEKKLVSYPRTDSRFLTEDMEKGLPELVRKASAVCSLSPTKIQDFHAIINGKKVTDHHAIIPTASVEKTDLRELPAGEREVLKLIAIRLLEAISSPCVYSEAVIEGSCAGQSFSAKGKTILDSGWKDVDPRKEKQESSEDDTLKWSDVLRPGRELRILSGSIKTGKTAPPKSYTEDTLLSAMERAGCDETPDEAERKGLGTPATRAGIIEKLVRVGFLDRRGDKKTKYLVPTHKGEALIAVMPESIQSASMTAEWEQKLLDIERDTYDGERFIGEIEELVRKLIDHYELIPNAEVLMKPVHDPIGKCPHCGGDIIEKSKGFFCGNQGCKFALWKENRFFDSLSKKMTKQIAEQLLKNGKANLKKCKSSKTGKTFDVTVVLTVGEDGRTQFSLEFENKKG